VSSFTASLDDEKAALWALDRAGRAVLPAALRHRGRERALRHVAPWVKLVDGVWLI
jgi:hypothetical protein